MTDEAALALAPDDRVTPFQVEGLDVRGRVVRLGDAVDTILRRHDYPAPVNRVLGEAVALATLLGTTLKFAGRFQLQTRGDGPISMVVVDFDAPDRIRACAQFDAARITGDPPTGELLGHGHLALTLDQGADMQRYQGVVALSGQGFEALAHQYFLQSEQIPTLIRLAVGEVQRVGEGEDGSLHWRTGGLLVQFLPQASERVQRRDLHPGDAPAGMVIDEVEPDEAWAEASSLVATVEDHELLDPQLGSERLLYRLFHERGVRVFEPAPVREACRCSRERILTMLRRFTAQERADMVQNGRIGVTCEFCSTHYALTPEEVEPLAADQA
jgi:molecular chaperone Hsp33